MCRTYGASVVSDVSPALAGWAKLWRASGAGGRSLFLSGPDDRQLLRDASEVRIPGDQRGFAKQGHGGCEAVDVRKLMAGFEFAARRVSSSSAGTMAMGS